MKKSVLLAFLPIVLILSSCASVSKTNNNYFIEDTIAHEDIFGAISSNQLQEIKLNPYKSLEEGVSLYQPKIGFQRKTNNDGTFSVRFVAAMQSATDSAYWTRSVHNLSGVVEKEKTTTEVTAVYSIVNGGDMPAMATDVQADDGTYPYDCYAVYCMINIPASYSDYYIDAFISVNNGSDSVNSKVGSINVANGDKHNTYSLGNNNRCLAFVNGKAVESGDLGDNNVAVYSASLKTNDVIQVYYVNQDTLSYSLYGNQSFGREVSHFSIENGDKITVNVPGVYDIFLNKQDKLYFNKQIYLEGKSGWANNQGYAEAKIGDWYSGASAMNYVTTVDGLPIYQNTIALGNPGQVQFSKTNSSDWTGWIDQPTNENNYFRYSTGRWSTYGVEGSEVSFTFDEDALNTPQEIHTTDQKNYLNYSSPYYSITGDILNTFHATGKSGTSGLTKESWAPKSVSVSWDYVAPYGKTVSKYQLEYSQYDDLSDSYIVEGTTAKSVSFVNPYLGDNYFRVIANFSDGTQEASPIKVFKVDAQAPRNLDVGNMPNCRDMGGRTTYAGGKIKQGLIYRTAGNKFDNSTQVNNECRNVLINQLKVKTEINVANKTDNNVNLSGGSVVNAYMDYGNVPYSNLARNAEKIRQVMGVLANANNYPVFYHCRIGTDRTGITGVMVGGLLGIKFNEIIQDYCFSNFSPIDNQRYPGKTPDDNGDDIKKYIDELLAMPGNTFQEQVYNALLTIGVPASTLNAIIDIMTIGPKAQIANIGKIGQGNDLSSTGTKKTGGNNADPDIYYQVTSNKQVSYSVQLTEGEKDIIVYMGCTDSISTSTTTLLKNCIKLKIDGAEKTITNSKNLWEAGFGTTKNNYRTGYMFNILGCYNLSAGQHTITITVTSGTFNIGTICVFDHVTPNA